MYYVIGFFGVIAFMFVISAIPGWGGLPPLKKTAPKAPGGNTANVSVSQMAALAVPPEVLRGRPNEEQPCLTPIDCVASNRCAGHCGCR